LTGTSKQFLSLSFKISAVGNISPKIEVFKKKAATVECLCVSYVLMQILSLYRGLSTVQYLYSTRDIILAQFYIYEEISERNVNKSANRLDIYAPKVHGVVTRSVYSTVYL
jgi:hypothetical protein